MSVMAVVGGQWGDEGKGKIVDYLSKNSRLTCRFQGGANAGHTVYFRGEKIVLHQIPSGILQDKGVAILGNGMVIDPIEIVSEVESLKKLNVSVDNNILISMNAHIVTPIHKAIDATNEDRMKNKIGTTLRGIGPTYVDKYNRIGIRAHDLLDMQKLKEKVEHRLRIARELGEVSPHFLYKIEDQIKDFLFASKSVSSYVSDVFSIIQKNIFDNENILIEGAQGSLLDIDHGTYPYVTSSNPTTGGISTGLGIPQTKVDKVYGIFKAYLTRVGEGPFPTELDDAVGEKIRDLGKEYGATTGRARRCGWFDLVAANYSILTNGITDIVLTKLDILDHFKEIKLCVGYKYKNKEIRHLSRVLHVLDEVEPVYKVFAGWNEDTSQIRTFSELPSNASNYLTFISEFLNTPISITSVGPERDQLIFSD
jgi:adenylosuccinate synthase